MHPIPWKIKLLREGAKAPLKKDPADLGFDLFYCPTDEDRQRVEGIRLPEPLEAIPDCEQAAGMTMWKLHTGVAMAFPPEYGLIFRGKSGRAIKAMWNPLGGIIDSGYRGELVVLMQVPSGLDKPPAPGEKICQAFFVLNLPTDIEIVDELPESVRGEGGFGSQGLT